MAAPSDYTVSTVDPDHWDALVEQFDDCSVYHTLPWLRALSEARGLMLVLAQVSRGDRCAAIWPCLLLRKGPFRVLGSPLPGWSTAYMGPLIKPDADINAVLEAFLTQPPLRKWSFFACRVFDRDHDVNLEPFGFTRGHREETYLIDLTRSEDEIWDSMEGRCRKAVRKARKLDVEIRREEDDDYMNDFWEMSCEVFARSNIEPTYTRRLAELVHRNLFPVGRLLVFSARRAGERLATLLLPTTRHTAYCWAGGTFAVHRSIPSNNLLHWHAMCQAKELGLRTYDFVNVSTGGGAGSFKKSFGPETVAIATHWEASRSKWIASLKDWYKRRLYRERRID